MLLQTVAWLSLGVVMFDMVQHYVGQFNRKDATLSAEELDELARRDGFCDWEQYVYYCITLEIA